MRNPRLFGWGTESENSSLFEENGLPIWDGCENNRGSILPNQSLA